MRGILITWAVAWPTVTALLLILDDIVGGWPLAFRTLVLTGLMVPLMSLVLVPGVIQLLAYSKRMRAD